MPPIYPQRSTTHSLEEISERFLNNHLPRNWTSEKPISDYGVDLKIDIFDETNARGLELLVQLKATATGTNRTYETVRLSTSTYNYLWDKLQVVMLIKYVQSENKAYWLLLSEVPEPNQNQQTFTIRIPKENDLENIDWQEIHDYVRTVTTEKLEVRRRDRRNT